MYIHICKYITRLYKYLCITRKDGVGIKGPLKYQQYIAGLGYFHRLLENFFVHLNGAF